MTALQDLKDLIICQEVEASIKKTLFIINKGQVLAGEGLLVPVVEHCGSLQLCERLILLLVTAGVDPDEGAPNGHCTAADEPAEPEPETPLRVAVRLRHQVAVRTLLQCGADPLQALQHADTRHILQQSAELSDVFDLFTPGLWEAVASQRLGDVRRLLNLWCRTDLSRGGRTLKQLALETGHEAIISLVFNIEHTMKCTLLVLAGNEQGVVRLLESSIGRKVNPNFRKQSERGAPLLYFAAQAGSVPMCRTLRQRGASLAVQMRDEEGEEMPLIFALLQPHISPAVLACLLPAALGSSSSEADRQGRQLLAAVCYRGRNVLTYAVERGLCDEMLSSLIQSAGPELVCERGPDNLCLPERLCHDPGRTALLRGITHTWITAVGQSELTPLLVRGCDWLERLMVPNLNTLISGECELKALLAEDLEKLVYDDCERGVNSPLHNDGDLCLEKLQVLDPTAASTDVALRISKPLLETQEDPGPSVHISEFLLPSEHKPAGDGDTADPPAGDGGTADPPSDDGDAALQPPCPALSPAPCAAAAAPEPDLACRRLLSFLRLRHRLQAHVDELDTCLRHSPPLTLELTSLADRLTDQQLWHARPSGDGTPLLVTAALQGAPSAAARLLRGLPAVDSVRDGFRRTALHYSSASGGHEMRQLLLHAGASDHTLDVNGREPLDFRDASGSERMEELLRIRWRREYSSPEPCPWEPEYLRQLQERRWRERQRDPALWAAAGHTHGVPCVHLRQRGPPAADHGQPDGAGVCSVV